MSDEVTTREVTFYSDGERISGHLRMPPSRHRGPLPAIVSGPGWLGLADGATQVPWQLGFAEAGYVVLALDYRGFGKSEGAKRWVRPEWQLEDIRNAVTYLETLDEVDSRRIGIYGQGGTGGGNAILAAARDKRIRCVVAQTVVADGRDWLRRMRSESDWSIFLERVAQDRRSWVRDGTGEQVNPRTELMVASAERALLNPKADVDARIEPSFYLRSADYLLDYRPLDVVDRVAPRPILITCVEEDVVTPTDHAIALFERAGRPKKLIRQHDTSHYRSYQENLLALLPEFVSWYDRYLDGWTIEVTEELDCVTRNIHRTQPAEESLTEVMP